MIGTHKKLCVFEEDILARTVFEHAAAHRLTDVACLMPDHLHWLLPESEELVQTVRDFKAWATRIAWPVGHVGKLWQRSFFDTVLRNERQVGLVAEYIVNNPVRSGLVENAGEYPWVCGVGYGDPTLLGGGV